MPRRRTQSISLRFPPEIDAKLRQLSEETGLGFSTLAQMCLEAGVKSWEANGGRLVIPLKKDSAFLQELRRQTAAIDDDPSGSEFRYQQKVAEEPTKASRRKKSAARRPKSDHHQLPKHDTDKPA